MTRIGSVLSPLLVGRDDVLELAARRLEEVAAGRGQFLLLSGEAGIGKTRMLRAIGKVAEGKGFAWQGGAIAPQDRDVPAAAFFDLARSTARVPGFGNLGDDLLNLLVGMTEAERPQRRLLVRRVVDVIDAAITRPLMLSFEDLQWADDLSLEILGELARQTRSTRLLLAGAYRTDAADSTSLLREWRARLVTQRLVEEIRLDRLTLEETGLVTTLIMDTGLPAPRDVVAAVHRRTDGVPLHIEELLGAIGAEGLADGRAIRDATVPDTLEDAVLARVSRLSEDAQAVARAGAVIGRCFAPDSLAGIMDRPVADLDDSLDELVHNAVLYPFEFVDRGYFDFRHQLLRDALYDSIPSVDLRRLHARAGEFGEQVVGAKETHASVHFERAGMRDEAFRAALNAARSAAKLSLHREAFELFRRAFDNMPDDLPPAEAAEIINGYTGEAIAIEENELGERLARQARELYLAAGDRVRAAGTLLQIGTCWRREGHPLPERLALAEQMLEELDAEPASAEREEIRSVAYALLGTTHVDALEYEQARAEIETYSRISQEADIAENVIDARIVLGLLDVHEGRIQEGLAAARAASDEARAQGFESTSVTGYRDTALLAARSMEYGQAALQMKDARQYADAIEQSHCARVMASTDALLAWAGGAWDDAVRIGEQSLADHGHGRASAIAHWALGFVAAGRGERDAADGHLLPALDFGRRADWIELTLPAVWGLAEAALVAGDPESAIRHCEAALSDARERGEKGLLVPFLVTGVRSYIAAGRPEAAVVWLDRATAAIDPSSTVATPALDHAAGLVRLAQGSVTAARDALEAAVRGWDDRGRRWEALWARLDLAGAMLRSNRYVDATRLIAEVREAARQMKSEPLLDRAAELERLARGRGAEQDPWHPLTVREFEVARQIAAGLTNAEIAAELFVAPKTVSSHVEHILAKLGAGRRAEIAAWVSSVTPATVA